MKKIFSIAIMAACVMMLSSCGNKKAQQTEAEASDALTIDQVLAQAESLTDQQVTIEGVCTHTCKHGATKIFLMGSDNTQLIRCEAASLGSFSKECVHSVVRVTGYVRETRMDEAYLQNWRERYMEAMVAQNQAETAAQNGGEPLDEEQVEQATQATGCATESAARGEQGNTIDEKIENYRQQIAARKEAEGKEYLSFFHIEATSYEIVNEGE